MNVTTKRRKDTNAFKNFPAKETLVYPKFRSILSREEIGQTRVFKQILEKLGEIERRLKNRKKF